MKSGMWMRGALAGMIAGFGCAPLFSSTGLAITVFALCAVAGGIIVRDFLQTRREMKELAKHARLIKWAEEHGKWPTQL